MRGSGDILRAETPTPYDSGHHHMRADPPLDLLIDLGGHVVLSPEVMEQLRRIEGKLDQLLGANYDALWNDNR